MDIRSMLADNLRYYRIKSGLNVEEVGAAVGRSSKTVSAWEVGRGQPDADMLLALCDLYNIDSIAQLFGEQITASEDALTDKERLLLKYYRNSNVRGQGAIIRAAKDIYKLQVDAPDKSNDFGRMENTA